MHCDQPDTDVSTVTLFLGVVSKAFADCVQEGSDCMEKPLQVTPTAL